jgi:glycosyltransferase involved in cell wall biosynthesis
MSAAGGPTIVIDGAFFQVSNTGIARLWSELLGRWQSRGMASHIVVIDRAGSLPRFERLRVVACPTQDYGNPEGDRRLVQDICDSVGADLFVSSYYTRPLTTPAAMVVYDMIPEQTGFDLSDAVWRQKHAAIADAVGFAAISQHTLQDLRRLFPATATRPSIVTLPGVSACFTPPRPEELRGVPAMLAPIYEGRSYVMFVSGFFPYKNPQVLLRALRRASPEEIRGLAVLFTRGGRELADFRAIPDLVVRAVTMSDPALRRAYGFAHALIYPSYYEGFGLPVVEAMACGCPVICSAGSSLPEAAGDAALFVDPDDDAQLLDAILRLHDPELRRSQIEKGYAQASKFRWERMARELALFLLQLAQVHGQREIGSAR